MGIPFATIAGMTWLHTEKGEHRVFLGYCMMGGSYTRALGHLTTTRAWSTY